MVSVRSLDHVGVNVVDLNAASEFFLELGLEIEGATSLQGKWVGDIIGLEDVHTDLVFMRTPDGSGKLELIKFHSPADDESPRPSAANRLGIRHLAFLVDDLNTIVDKLRDKSFSPIGKVHDYENIFRLCYIR